MTVDSFSTPQTHPGKASLLMKNEYKQQHFNVMRQIERRGQVNPNILPNYKVEKVDPFEQLRREKGRR